MKKSSVEIVKAESDDFEGVLRLVNTTNSEWFSKIIPKEFYREPFLTREQFDEMAMCMDFFTHRVDGEIIAVGSLGTRDKGTAWIPLMAVRTDHQRCGVGSAIMQYLEKLAREQGFSTICLETDSKADWALNFYTKHGYVVFKREKNPWGYHVWMEKQIK